MHQQGLDSSPVTGTLVCGRMDESSLLLPENSSDQRTWLSNRFPRREAIILYALLFFFALSNPFYVPAINKIVDDAIQSLQGSQDHFNSLLTSILRDDRQRELALIRGTQGFLDNAVGAAVSIVLALVRSRMLPQRVSGWFGFLDSCEKVLRLSLLGLFLGKSLTAAFFMTAGFHRISLRFSWILTLSNLLGGGGAGFYAMVWTCASNLSSSTDNSFKDFIIISILDLALQFAATFVASSFIEEHAVLVTAASCLCLVISGTLACFYKMTDQTQHEGGRDASASPDGHALLDWLRRASAPYNGYRWLLLTFLLSVPGIAFEDIKLQYLKDRYGLSWQQATKYSSWVLLCQIAFLALAYATWSMLTSKGTSASSTASTSGGDDMSNRASKLFDLGWACFCAASSGVGLLVFGLSEEFSSAFGGLVAFYCGLAFRLFIRHFLSLAIDNDLRQSLFLFDDAIESVGALLMSFALSRLNITGVDLGGGWRGLPFLFQGAFGFINILILSCWLCISRHSPLRAGDS